MLKRSLIGIFSILYWTWFILTNIVFFSVALVIWFLTVLFDKRLVLLHQFSSLWGHSYIWLNPLWPLKMTGRENIKRDRTCVIISNHQSMLDILVLYGLFRHYKWVSKKENFSIPIIGWLMRLSKYIELERGSTGSYLNMMRKIRQTLNDGNSILMFPEGTRNTSGDGLGPFRDGAFRMALENKVGIIPVILDGTAHTIPKGKIILKGKQRLTVKILPEIPYDSFKDKTSRELMNEVRTLMIREFEEISKLAAVQRTDPKSGIKYSILRKMKYVSDQEGILEKYLEEHEGWQEHLQNSKQFIMECVKKHKPQNVVIMGSGWLLDVPLKELSAECKQVYLADIWHPGQVRMTVRDFPNCSLIYTDLTGGAVTWIYSLVKSYRKTDKKDSLKSFSSGKPELPSGETYLVSLNIINQLDIILMNWLNKFIKYPEEEIYYFRKKIQENHLELLKPGHSCLICDQKEIILDHKNQVVSTNKPVYADLPGAARKKEWKWVFDRGGVFGQNYKTEFNIIALEL